jgi:hypothetical protein
VAFVASFVIKRIIPKDRFKKVSDAIMITSDGLFAPVFFLWIGISNFFYNW